MSDIDKVKKLIVYGNELLETKIQVINYLGYIDAVVDDNNFKSWVSSIKSTMQKIFGTQSEEYKFFAEYLYTIMTTSFEVTKTFLTRLNTILQDLEEVYDDEVVNNTSQNAISILQNIFEKFSSITSQLSARYGKRSTINIDDEYDVQDLLHALLKLFFNDIRAEECCPSYSAKKARTDFLLEDEKIFIEVKKTNPRLQDKEISEQLIEDRSVYSKHPSCQTLVCFVYDPDRIIKNKIGIIKDIENTKDIKVKVFIEN